MVYSVDHHRGSEENQSGWEWHDPDLVDAELGVMDTLPFFRRTIYDAGLEDVVIAVVGDSPIVAADWRTPLALVFIDGGHGAEPARADYDGWTPHVAPGGPLAIHDVFPDPADGGRPPYEESICPPWPAGNFDEVGVEGSSARPPPPHGLPWTTSPTSDLRTIRRLSRSRPWPRNSPDAGDAPVSSRRRAPPRRRCRSCARRRGT